MICSSVNRVVFISAILQNLRTSCHYLGTAGRGQVRVGKLNDDYSVEKSGLCLVRVSLTNRMTIEAALES